MATVIDITVNQIKSSMPIPAPQILPPKIIVKRDADKSEKDKVNVVVADLGLQSKEEVARMAEDIKSVVEFLNTNVSFSIERDLHPDIVIAKVIDKDTGDVIRQIPSEEIVELAKRLDEFVGIVFNKKT